MRTHESRLSDCRWTAPHLLRPGAYALLVLAVLLGPITLMRPDGNVAAQGAGPVDGSLATQLCTDFSISLGFLDIDIPDPGWVWVNRAEKFQSVSGVATKSEVSYTDFPGVHLSHDQNTDITLDPGQQYVLSNANKPNNTDWVPGVDQLLQPTKIEMEWEIGTYPNERSAASPERFFPKWAWPSVGDRVWANGHWVFDCGHAKPVGGEWVNINPGGTPVYVLVGAIDYYRTEIHPARAIASMRNQVRTLPGTGTTPIPVTATDLYIHGRSGLVANSLYWGMDFLLANIITPDYAKTPIDDNYEFDIYLPPKPAPQAIPVKFVEDGPDNTINIAPELQFRTAAQTLEGYDPDTMLHVRIPLAGTGVNPDDVYARKIYAGWLMPQEGLRHLTLSLNKMYLHDDQEPEGADGELTFFWFNVNRAADEWSRLVDYQIPTDDDAGFLCFQHTNTLNDYDDDNLCGNGQLQFSGPTLDFYVSSGQDFTVAANGYDQDCTDDWFGEYGGATIQAWAADCYLIDPFAFEAGNNDELAKLSASYGPSDNYGVGTQRVAAGDDYDLEFTIQEIPVLEQAADLSISKDCQPDRVLSGGTFSCTLTVQNAGPGLPADVVVTDTLSTSLNSSYYAVSNPAWTIPGAPGAPVPCTMLSDNQFTCGLPTVPVGGSTIITVSVTSQRGANFTNTAIVSAATSDPVSGNNTAQDSVAVVQIVRIDVKPGGVPNAVNVNPNQKGDIPVAILSTPDFNAVTQVDRSSLTFGRSGDESSLAVDSIKTEDVNSDGLPDLIIRFNNSPPLFQCTDALGILKGKMLDNVLIQGQDSIKPSPCP